MTETHATLTRRRLKTPSAAAIAGIIFALLFGTGVVLIRISIPADPAAESAWLDTNSRTVSLALNLMPYAGIAFLWFIGVIRDRLEDLEDRLFATVFLGNGLLFLALTFVGAALAGGLRSSFAVAPSALVESGVFTYSRAASYLTLNVYAMRMAGVFMISLGTICLHTDLIAGLTEVALLIPEGIASANLAGANPVNGHDVIMISGWTSFLEVALPSLRLYTP